MLREAEFALIAREVRLRSGAALERERSDMIELRLLPIVRREGFASVSELVAAARVRNDGALWNAAADALSDCETRFFRDRALFERLRVEILPEALSRRGRARIWCAACSTGQEPYSVAMSIEELRAEGFAGAAEIVATDFSERLLDKARSGLFTQFDVQLGLSARKLIAHFEKAGEMWRIADSLRACVRFERHNLLRPATHLGQFDVILLCNVLSGLDADARRAVVAHAADVLVPGGALVLGPGETAPRGSLVFERGVARKPNAARHAA